LAGLLRVVVVSAQDAHVQRNAGSIEQSTFDRPLSAISTFHPYWPFAPSGHKLLGECPLSTQSGHIAIHIFQVEFGLTTQHYRSRFLFGDRFVAAPRRRYPTEVREFPLSI